MVDAHMVGAHTVGAHLLPTWWVPTCGPGVCVRGKGRGRGRERERDGVGHHNFTPVVDFNGLRKARSQVGRNFGGKIIVPPKMGHGAAYIMI